MVPRTHNRNSWPEILRSTNRLATAAYPSTVVSCCHVYATIARPPRLAVLHSGDIFNPHSALRTAESALSYCGGGHRSRAQRLPLTLPPKHLSRLSPFDHRQVTAVVSGDASVCDFANLNFYRPILAISTDIIHLRSKIMIKYIKYTIKCNVRCPRM